MTTIKKSSPGKPGVVAHAFNPCTQEKEAGESLSSRTAREKQNNNKKVYVGN